MSEIVVQSLNTLGESPLDRLDTVDLAFECHELIDDLLNVVVGS